MRGYQGIEQSTSSCVHFVRGEIPTDALREVFAYAIDRNITCAYIDFKDCSDIANGLAIAIGDALALPNIPYTSNQWLLLLDDLISMSVTASGLVIVIDSADILLSKDIEQMFDLIESFLTQVHHWLDKAKPCHLCFQLDKNSELQQIFRHSVNRVCTTGI